MIAMVQPLPVGNALRLFLEPPSTAVRWKVLRKGSATIAAHDDSSAAAIYDGDERSFIDTSFLLNGVMAFYRAFYTTDGVVWTPSLHASGTPAAIYEEQTTDVHAFVRDRIEAGLKVEVERGTLASELGYIRVFTASPFMERDLVFPLVTVHLDSEAAENRGIGELIAGDEFDGIGGDWTESEGWHANVQLAVIGWSLNSDERAELRRAIRRIIIANLPVFSEKGWQNINLSQSDVDALSGEYSAPVYQAMNTFSCLAPVAVAGNVSTIREVIARSL